MTPLPKTITNVAEQILISLGRYKFLTVSQMLKAGVGTVSTRYLRSQLKVLLTGRRRPLIGVIEYAPSGPMRGGRYEYMYFLKPYGKKLLVEQLGLSLKETRMPIGHPQFHRLYHHRRMQIDFHIMLYQWSQNLDLEISLYECDFDTIGGNRSTKAKLEARTKIYFPPHYQMVDFIIPDGAFILETSDGQKFYLSEFHRGSDVKRAIQQLYHHAQAIGLGLPSTKYNIEKSNRVLMIFEKEGVMHSVQQKMATMPVFAQLTQHFLFKPFAAISTIGDDWLTLDGELIGLL